MSIILSLSNHNGALYAAGPEGLYQVDGVALQPVPQPEQNLYCCCAIHDRVLVGGLPHGVAFMVGKSGNWQAGWMDAVDAPVVSLAADPNVEETGVVLAGTDGGGILRTTNRGYHWSTRNFGLRSFTVLSLVWAPPAPVDAWPRWQAVFASTEEGIYHSPNGGRGWRRAESPEAVYQALAVAPDYHTSGIVLAGTEEDGLFRSTDGGHTFTPVPDSPRQINALAATAQGWLLSDEQGIWRSRDALTWEQVANSQPALILHASDHGVLAGTENGLTQLDA